MDLLQNLLSKQQSKNGYNTNQTYLNFTPYQKDIRIKKYKPAHSQPPPPKTLTQKAQSCQLKPLKKHDQLLTSRNQPNLDSFDLTLTQRSTRSKLYELNKKALNNMSDYLNTEYNNWPKTVPSKEFSITISTSRSRNFSSSVGNKFYKKSSRKKYQPLQLQVNRFPIMRKKQSKRKQIAEAFNLKPHYTPQLEHHFQPKKPSIPIIPRATCSPGSRERIEICGWEEADPYDFEQ